VVTLAPPRLAACLAEHAKYAATQMSIRNPALVIPAEAGIQAFQRILDPGFRRGDGSAIGYFILWICTKHTVGCKLRQIPRLLLMSTTLMRPLGKDFSVIAQWLQMRSGLLHSSQ
jgi:hypothetical protein